MNEQNEPNDAPLRSLLRESSPAPPLPPRFRESVWRRIEHGETKDAARQSPFAACRRWAERLLLPRFALASLALLLVAGALTGILNGTEVTKRKAQERYLSAVAPNPVR